MPSCLLSVQRWKNHRIGEVGENHHFFGKIGGDSLGGSLGLVRGVGGLVRKRRKKSHLLEGEIKEEEKVFLNSVRRRGGLSSPLQASQRGGEALIISKGKTAVLQRREK